MRHMVLVGEHELQGMLTHWEIDRHLRLAKAEVQEVRICWREFLREICRYVTVDKEVMVASICPSDARRGDAGFFA